MTSGPIALTIPQAARAVLDTEGKFSVMRKPNVKVVCRPRSSNTGGYGYIGQQSIRKNYILLLEKIIGSSPDRGANQNSKADCPLVGNSEQPERVDCSLSRTSAFFQRNKLFSTICTIQQNCKQDNGFALLSCCLIHRIVATLENLLVTIISALTC